MVDAARIRLANAAPLRPDRPWVLYWMTAARRTRYNPALERAIRLSQDLGRPLLVFEPFDASHRWASARFTTFALQGIADTAAAFAARGVTHVPFVTDDRALLGAALRRMIAGAAVVVADDAPLFTLPEVLARVAAGADVRVEAVDGWGLYPIRATDRAFGRAVDFRRHLQKVLAPHLDELPEADPLARYTLGRATSPIFPHLPEGAPGDPAVGPVALRGGESAGREALERFVPELGRYGEERSHPDAEAQSGLSPWLHWGHLAVYEVYAALAQGARPAITRGASKEGGWGGHPAEPFLDELVTWRELCANSAVHLPGYTRYDSLPAWARATLGAHAGDERRLYSLDELEAGETHDRLWNAAQRQLRGAGIIHNYLRMLWGKKVLEWSPSPEEAWERLVELNNRWAIDGRDPNSWGGIAWVFGRYDRPWVPERPVFGTIRYMSSDAAARKLALDRYLTRWGARA